jgi:hypothetical protein
MLVLAAIVCVLLVLAAVYYNHLNSEPVPVLSAANKVIGISEANAISSSSESDTNTSTCIYIKGAQAEQLEEYLVSCTMVRVMRIRQGWPYQTPCEEEYWIGLNTEDGVFSIYLGEVCYVIKGSFLYDIVDSQQFYDNVSSILGL